jgi:retinol dehydrogenase-12
VSRSDRAAHLIDMQTDSPRAEQGRATPNLDLAGRRYVVTGANTGIGRATAHALAMRGAHVVRACRCDPDALPELPSASYVRLDLGDLASVRAAANELGKEPIDALINNAGVGGTRGITKDGFELHFGVNYLGHYLLTRLLMPALREAVPSRIVHVVSGSHHKARELDLARVREPTRSAFGLNEYASSKLCNLLFHHELMRRMIGSRVKSYAADPGNVASDGWRHVPWPIRPLMKLSMKSTERGALTSVFCTTEPIPCGAYVDMRPDAPSRLSRDPALARELWERSAEWVGLPR